jgi:hypothetical protein
MIELKQKYERMGMIYKQMFRTKDVAIYAVFLAQQRVNYEVFRVSIHKPLPRMKESFERYPSNEQFGYKAWSYNKIEDALIKAKELAYESHLE